MPVTPPLQQRPSYDRPVRGRLAATALGCLVLPATLLSAAPAAAQPVPAAQPAQSAPASQALRAQAFTAAQVQVARAIHQVARSVGASERARLAAFEAGLVEANMQADPKPCEGDHDSAGLFQQRRSWVPVGERPTGGGWCVRGRDPRLSASWAARGFFQGSNGHRGALHWDERTTDYRGKRIRTAGDLAQATQVSGYPDRYDARAADARALLRRVAPGGNPYTPEQTCGRGFTVIDQAGLKGSGTVYLLWNRSTRSNCVVTMKARSLGSPTATSAFLQPDGRARTTNTGRFRYYAGPVTLKAPSCIRWGGASSGVSYTSLREHCGT